ncbi:MAG: hypothetical protein AAF564_09110 [Bacteroidota bacterium]
MPSNIDELLSIEHTVLESRWQVLLAWLEDHFGRQAGIESILFLIGIQSQERGYEPKLSKKKKQALIMEGTHCAFETLGLYRRVGKDSNGQIVWERTEIPLKKLPLPEQEKLLRVAILSYFDKLNNG